MQGRVLGLGIDVVHVDPLVDASQNHPHRVLFAVVEEGVVELLRIRSTTLPHRV